MAAPSTSRGTRDRLIEVAMELFYVQGYEATSVAEILQKAGANSGSLYYYFKSKEDLLLAVLEHYKELLWPMVIEPAFAGVADPVQRIFNVLEGYRRGLMLTVFTGGCPIGNLALEVGDHYPLARRKIAENFEGWCGWVRKCLDEAADRLPAEVDREQLARFILTVMEGGVMQARAHGSIAPFDACVAHLRDYLNRLLVDRSSKKTPAPDEPGKPLAG